MVVIAGMVATTGAVLTRYQIIRRVASGTFGRVFEVTDLKTGEPRALKLATQGEAMLLDEDFLVALEHAMPPCTGTGMGIDRLLMALTGLSIRETVLFPIVRPHSN